MSNAKLDENSRQTLTAVSSGDGSTIVNVYADPNTHRLLVNSTGGGGGGTNIYNSDGVITNNDARTVGIYGFSTSLKFLAKNNSGDDNPFVSMFIQNDDPTFNLTTTNNVGDYSSLYMYNGNAYFQDGRPTTLGIQYQADYSAGFDDRSLVDKGYVDTNSFWSQTGDKLFPKTSTNRVVLGGLTDDTTNYLQSPSASFNHGLIQIPDDGGMQGLFIINSLMTGDSASFQFQEASVNYWREGKGAQDGSVNYQIYNYVTGTTNLSIDSATGYVGIDTLSPSVQLSLGNSLANTKLALYDDSGSTYGFGVQGGQFIFHPATNTDKYSFYDDDSLTNEIVTILGSGNVGIGTTTPSYTLEVDSIGSNLTGSLYVNAAFSKSQVSGKGFFFGYDDSGQIGVIAGNTDGTPGSIAFWTYNGAAWSENMRVDATTGFIGIGTTSPVTTLEVNGDVTVDGLTASLPVYTDANKKLVSGSPSVQVVASGSQLAQTGASTLCTEASPSAGSYEVGGYINISAISAGTVSLVVDYNDDVGASKTVTIPLVQLAGTIVAASTAVADLSAVVTSIQTDGSANIVARVTFTGVSVSYSGYAYIKKIV